jgi:hypothetical protein
MITTGPTLWISRNTIMRDNLRHQGATVDDQTRSRMQRSRFPGNFKDTAIRPALCRAVWKCSDSVSGYRLFASFAMRFTCKRIQWNAQPW